MGWNALVDWVLDDPWGYQSANNIKNNVLALASARLTHALGGSRSVALPLVASAQKAPEYIDIELDGTLLSGLTIQVRAECRTAHADTSVTPELYNVTDLVVASAAGAACVATSTDYDGANQKQTLAVTLAAGVKVYRLRGTPSNTTHPTFVVGYLEIYVDA